MTGVSVTFGASKTSVNQVALYKIEEETPDRLVLRAKKIAYSLGGAMLILFGGILTFVAVGVVTDTGPRIGLGAFGLLLLAGAYALIRAGIRNKDRVVFERSARAVRFDMTKEKDRYSVPFVEIARFDLRQVDESTASEEKVLYKVFIVRKNGDEIRLDEASNPGQMALLGLKASTICGVPFADGGLGRD